MSAGEYEVATKVEDLRSTDHTTPLTKAKQMAAGDAPMVHRACVAAEGKIDALFNCAGLPQSCPPLDVMKVNFIGTRHLTEQVLPLMGEGGAIASIASTGGLGWSRRIPTNMEFVTTKGWDAAVSQARTA